jgi:hypothetical protein
MKDLNWQTLLKRRNIIKDSTSVREGEAGHVFYILLEGEVVATK